MRVSLGISLSTLNEIISSGLVFLTLKPKVLYLDKSSCLRFKVKVSFLAGSKLKFIFTLSGCKNKAICPLGLCL